MEVESLATPVGSGVEGFRVNPDTKVGDTACGTSCVGFRS